MRRTIVAIVLAAATVAHADPGSWDSYPPTLRAAEAGQPPQSHPAATQEERREDQRGTTNAPLIVKTLPADDAESKADEERADREQHATAERWLVAFAGLLAFFTVVLAIATGGLFVATWNLVRDGRRHSERQLRAYINCIDAKVRDFDGPNASANITLRNSGQTPAYNVVTIITGKLAEYPLATPLEFHPDAERKRNGVVGVGLNFYIKPPIREPSLLPLHRSLIEAGSAGFYVYGRCDYRDAFGRDLWTTFRVVYNGSIWAREPGDMTVCEGGNDAS